MRFALTPTGQLGSVLALTCALILMLPDGAAVKNSNLDIVCNEDCTRFKCDVGQTCNKVRPLGKTYDCFECRNCTNLRKYSKTLMPDEVYTKDEECVHIKVTCGGCPACPQAASTVPTSSSEASPDYAVQLLRMAVTSSSEASFDFAQLLRTAVPSSSEASRDYTQPLTMALNSSAEASPDNTQPPRMASNASSGATPGNTELLGSPDCSGVWGAFSISMVVNLLLFKIIVINYRRKRPDESRMNMDYETLQVLR